MSIYEQLYDWQKKIVDKFYTRPSFGLYLDMGLGKTPISLAFAEKNECNKILVITINSKALETIDDKGSWSFWASKLSKSPISVNKSSFKKQKDQSFLKILNGNKRNPLLYITNYEALFSRKKDRKQNVELSDDIKRFINVCEDDRVAIIIDECHKMKDLQSSQTKAIVKIKKELQRNYNDLYLYLLSGTPFTTGYIDLYSQLRFLGYEKNKSEFVDEYCIRGNLPGLLGWQQPIIGYKNVDSLYKLIHKYALTMKSEDVIDLPEKVFVEHVLPKSVEIDLYSKERIKNELILSYLNKQNVLDVNILNSYNKKDTQSLNPFYRNIDYPSTKWIADTTGTLWLRARELSIGFQGNAEEYKWYHRNRLDKLEEFLENNPDNYLIFYNYTPELFEIFDICEKLGYKIDVYSGEIKSMNNYNVYMSQNESEQMNNTKNVIIANFASGSTGMNWQGYNKCIIFSLPLYKDYEQGIKRIHRIGQNKTTIYHMFYEDNWLDNSMLKALKEQIDYSTKMFETDFKKQSILDEIEEN